MLLAATLEAGAGGIARVARLIARVLVDEGVSFQGLALADAQPDTLPFALHSARHGKLRFVARAMASAQATTHYISDGCHVAQALRFPILRRKPSLVYLHGIELWDAVKPGYLKSARHATVLLANSKYTHQRTTDLYRDFRHAKVCWLATESDDTPAPSAQHSAPGTPEVLIVGRLAADRPKGHEELIACWPRVTAAVPEAMLRIVGHGPKLKSLQSLAAASPAEENIVFTGFVSDPELEELYRRATVFAMPSRGEGFGLVYIEAMRHGLPVVASIHDAAPEIVLDGQTGFTVKLDSPEELPDRLIYLLRNPDRARQLGVNGQRRWFEHFRYSAFRQRFLPILSEFLRLE